jgi:hypothetical protein
MPLSTSPGATVQSPRLALLTGLALVASPTVSAQVSETEDKADEARPWESLLARGQSILDRAPDNLELSVGGGLRFEDNLVVDSLDVSSPESDFAAVGTLDLTYEDTVGSSTDLRTGYVFEQRRYFEERDFDLQLHYGFVDLSRELSGITAGILVDATYARLGGESLLTKQKVSGYVADLVTPELYARGGLALETTDLKSAEGRDNNGRRLDASAFYFLDGIRQYLTFKTRFEQSRADDSVFDYSARRISIGYVERVTLGNDRPVRVRADWRYEERRYDETDPSLNARRRDDRMRWRLRLDTPVNDSVSLGMKLEHRDYESNNAALDFNDNRVELMVEVTLL